MRCVATLISQPSTIFSSSSTGLVVCTSSTAVHAAGATVLPSHCLLWPHCALSFASHYRCLLQLLSHTTKQWHLESLRPSPYLSLGPSGIVERHLSLLSSFLGSDVPPGTPAPFGAAGAAIASGAAACDQLQKGFISGPPAGRLRETWPTR